MAALVFYRRSDVGAVGDTQADPFDGEIDNAQPAGLVLESPVNVDHVAVQPVDMGNHREAAIVLDPAAGDLEALTGILGRPVRDQTGLTGSYDFKLDYAPDMDGAATESGPSVFTAVQELGLKLASGKGPVEAVVIDHVEKPSAN